MTTVDVAEPLLREYDSYSAGASAGDTAAVSLWALEDAEEGFEKEKFGSGRSVIERLLMAVRKRHAGVGKEGTFDRVRFPLEDKKPVKRECRVRGCGTRRLLGLPLLVVVFFGLFHASNAFMSLVGRMRYGDSTYSHDFLPLEQYRQGDFTGLTHNVKPVHCHSHNDYWRRVPLFEALRWGCTGVEADVWLFPERSNELLVGHSRHDLTLEHNFRSMYVEPLMQIVDQRNIRDPSYDAVSRSEARAGVFEMDPRQTLVLLVDFKNDGHALYPVVSRQLEPLRRKGYLSYYDGRILIPGPITIVATGNAPFDLITRNKTHRDIFFDAPLSALTPTSSHDETRSRSGQGTVGTSSQSRFDLTNSYYASVDFKKAVGFCWFGRLSSKQKGLIKKQIRAAKDRGLKSRYWGAPTWPDSLRNMVWRTLVDEGVDYLNGDDLRELTRGDWGAEGHGSRSV